jgi:hypothetical protein
MGARVVDDSFRTVLDQVFEKLQGLGLLATVVAHSAQHAL